MEKLKEYVQAENIEAQLKEWLADLDPKVIGEAALKEVAKKLTYEVGKVVVTKIISLIPVPSPDKIITIFQNIYDGVKFFFDSIKKAEKIGEEINNVATAVVGLQAGAGAPVTAVKMATLRAIKAMGPIALDMVVDKIPGAKNVIEKIKAGLTHAQDAVKNAIGNLFKKLKGFADKILKRAWGGATQLGTEEDRKGQVGKAKTWEWGGKTRGLWGRYTNGTGEVMMPYQGKGQPTQTKTARALLDYWQTKINDMPPDKKPAAQARYQTANTRLTGAVATEFQKVKTAQDQVNAATKDQQGKRAKTTDVQVKIKALNAEKKVFQTAIDQLSKDMQAIEKVCEAGACFAAGTKLLAKGVWGIGYREIERITTDDYVASRDENRPDGQVEWKQVQEIFVRTGRIINLNIKGQVIRTTPEHPFFVENRGWTPASELNAGDWLLGQGNETSCVLSIADTDDYGVVYNLSVADWHTYFVGNESWDWSIWAHNACINIALGLDAGLLTFARNHDAKMYKDWLPEYFGRDPGDLSWDPADVNGGTSSKFASAFRVAVEQSKEIFFNLEGFNLDYWNQAAKEAKSTGFGSVRINGYNIGSTTPWELGSLVGNTSRHGAMHFVSNNADMSFDQFKIKTYAIDHFSPAVRAEKTNNPNWKTSIASTNAIATLVNYFDYTDDKIEAI